MHLCEGEKKENWALAVGVDKPKMLQIAYEPNQMEAKLDQLGWLREYTAVLMIKVGGEAQMRKAV